MESKIILILAVFGYVQLAVSFKVPFQYHLEERSHAVEGHVGHDVIRGTRIKAILADEGTGGGEEGHTPTVTTDKFLQVVASLKTSKSRGTTRDFSISMTTSPQTLSHGVAQRLTTLREDLNSTRIRVEPTAEPKAAEFLSTLIESLTTSHQQLATSQQHTGSPPPSHAVHRRAATQVGGVRLDPAKVRFVVEDTTAFRIDDYNFLVVNDTDALQGHGTIDFYVYLEDSSNGEAVSNPLPFVVHIDYPHHVGEEEEEDSDSGYPTLPAVFAGVLVLIVVFFALFIPLVTRAKRRYKEGKPMFKPGSHPSTSDLQRLEGSSMGSGSGMPRVNSEVNWYGANNVYYNYAEEVDREKSAFTSDIKHYSRSPSRETPTLQLTKKKPKLFKETISETSSSGVETDVAGAGVEGSFSQRL